MQAARCALATLAVVLAVALDAEKAAVAESRERASVAAQRVQRVCRDRVSLRHAPAGAVIGYVFRGDRVIVALYARRHRWAYAIGARGHGWLLTSGLCRRSTRRET